MKVEDKKLCIIYNFAQKYREGIFSRMDHTYNCHWVFGTNNSDIKDMDLSKLRSTQEVTNKYVPPFYWQKGVLKLLRQHNRFLILGELFCLSTWCMLLLRRTICPNKRIYLWSHGWYGREGFLKKWLKRIYFSLADATFLYGNYARKVAIKQGNNGDKLFVIHNSLDHNHQVELRQQLLPTNNLRSHFGNDDRVLLFIGRLTRVKRLDILIDAMSKLERDGKHYNLVLVGGGEESDALKKLVEEKGLTKRVWFYGPCYDDTQNAQLIYDADLCVSPGNVGLTAMHSLVFGTPVLTHNDFTMQMPEFEAIIQDVTGGYFEYDNSQSIADSITSWFEKHTNDREQIRQNCYAEIDNYWTPEFQLNVLQEHIL